MSVEGLKAYRESKEKSASGGNSTFLRLKDGQKVKIRPLQELDSDSKNLSKKNGLAKFTKEWDNPNDFTRSCVDTTEDEGACVGPELLRDYGWGDAENKGWRPKDRMYLNVLVDNGVDEPYVAILQCNIAQRAVQGPALIDHSDESEDHSITDRWWAYSREGTGQYDTNYKLKPLDPPKDPLPSVEDYELLDLEEATPRVPYANQRAVLGVDQWIANYGEKVRAATAAKNSSKDSGTKTERVATQNTEW